MTRGLFQMYQRVLMKRPYLVQAVQTGFLMGAGDVISQTFVEKKAITSIEVPRALRFASIGLFIAGPALRVWYGILYKYVGSTGPTVAVKKMLVDQLCFAPTFICVLLVSIGTLQGKDWDNIKKDLNLNYFEILKVNYCIWPFVQLFNFYFIPLQYQVLLAQVVALFWNTYLAWKTNRTKKVFEKTF